MESLPPVTLGAIILGAYAVIAVLRGPAETAVVRKAALYSQPKRQFYLDLALSLLAGTLAAAFNTIVYHFPLVSALSLLLGCAVAGFFLAIDMALQRERSIILETVAGHDSLQPPKHLFPVTRKFTLVAVTTSLFVSTIIVLVIARDIIWLSKIDQTEAALLDAQLSVTTEIFFIMAILLALVINLIVSYSKNLDLLFNNETSILERVSRGDLSRLVPIATNDEFGLIADHTNTMIQGLRHRIQLISALKLAEAVQQDLLPQHAPQYPGLDVSGTSVYCDETGGDYYDFLEFPGGRLGVVVADASDHGVGSAIHMTTARAFLVYGARQAEGPAALLADVNRYLARDSRQTGRFVSLFLLDIDPGQRILRWVRAGHEPALLFDPAEEVFHLLDGEGIVLGVDENARFREYQRSDWTAGSVVVIGTDGIHESRDADGRMFGRERLQQIIRANHKVGAELIQKAIFKELRDFQGNASQEDDITLVVVKLL